MEHTQEQKRNETPSKSAVALLIAVVVIIGILFATTKLPVTTKDTVSVATEQSQDICYYSSTPTVSGFNDTYALKLTVTNEGGATGELATVPAEKDSMRGTLSGVVVPDGEGARFIGTYANTAEGMNNIDQKMIKLSDTAAMIGYGEMKQEADGSYSYVNVSAVDYSFTIPRVDCTIYPTTV